MLLMLVASAAGARAVPFDFMYTGSVATFTVPTTGSYQILVFGAQGGAGTFSSIVGAGGLGAEISGDFGLTAGDVLQIAVGGIGMSSGAGPGEGGGGSFVVGPNNTPLVIAGGGGGGAGFVGGSLSGQGGLTTTDGGSVLFIGDIGNGGTNGNGGGSGGGGFFSAGQASLFGDAEGGAAFPDLAGGQGGGDGGFGGGGGASGGGFPGAHGGGGGGGGYSGGGGFGGNLGDAIGGGGGSFDAGTNQILAADFRTGNGEILITELAAAVPEPASISLLGVGLAGLMTLWRRRRPHS